MKQKINADSKPHVGIGVIIRKKDKIVLGRRLKQPMPGSWQLPGGWIRFGESPEQAVLRLLTGFSGLKYRAAEFITYTNNVFKKNTHSLSLYFKVNCLNENQLDLGVNSECDEWIWADWCNLPEPLFLPLKILKQKSPDIIPENNRHSKLDPGLI